MFTQEALIGVPNLAAVKLCWSGEKFQLELDWEYCAARMLPAISCMNTHRSSSAQLVAAIELSCKSFGVPAGKPVLNDKLTGFSTGSVGAFSGAFSGAGTVVDLDSMINFMCL